MKRLIVKYNRVIRREEMDKIEAKAQKEWKEKEAVFIPECCDYEIIDDGVNEAAIWLDQEIEKRKAAVENKKVKYIHKILNLERYFESYTCTECRYRFEGSNVILPKYCPGCGKEIELEDRQSKD